jgi:putative component of membrane protein insertase Oxa1/YidC/SpoIIIJ protein YidD
MERSVVGSHLELTIHSGSRRAQWRGTQALANTVSVAACHATALCIGAYQKYISPHKGFSCPYRPLYGETSCSEYIKRAILEHGIRKALSLARCRFTECKSAGQILRATTQQGPPGTAKHKENDDRSSCDCLDLGCDACMYVPEAWCSHMPDFQLGHCDVGLMDCSHCGPCDCWPF